MTIALGKLAGLKRLLNTTESSRDDELRGYLLHATAMARHGELAGRDLTRQRNTVEIHPTGSQLNLSTKRLRLNYFPVQAVTEVVAPGASSTAAAFDAAVTAGNVLVEGTDFRVEADRGVLMRYNTLWPLYTEDAVRVTYTAGYGDPADLEATINSADNTQLDVSAGFAEPDGLTGDPLWYAGGSLTGFADGRHVVYITDVAGTATLVTAAGDSFPAQTATAHTPVALVTVAGGAGAIVDVALSRPWPIPSATLQAACEQQAHLLYQTRDTAGLDHVNVGGAGGSYTPAGEPILPLYRSECQTLKRWTL